MLVWTFCPLIARESFVGYVHKGDCVFCVRIQATFQQFPQFYFFFFLAMTGNGAKNSLALSPLTAYCCLPGSWGWNENRRIAAGPQGVWVFIVLYNWVFKYFVTILQPNVTRLFILLYIFWTVVLEKTLENPLDCKESKLVHPRGDQSWVFIGRTDVEAETPILWPPHAKSGLIGKDPDAGKDWGQEEKGMTEDEMVGWHHWINGHEFE